MSMDRIPYHYLRSVKFGIYSSEQIKKLSVKEVSNVNTFDTLDHPSENGLYDPAFGPNEKDESCTTCGLNYFHCPGHVGHISLPLPVFNPLFIKNLYQILRGSCFECHQLLAPPCPKQLALFQFQALDYGLIGTVQELEEAVSDPRSFSSRKDSTLDVQLKVNETLKTIFENAIKDLDLDDARRSSKVKNVVECHQRIMKKFVKEHLMGAKGKCPHCGEKKQPLALRQNASLIFSGVKKPIAFRDNSNLQDEEELDKCKFASNTYFTPIEAREQLRLLWQSERAILQGLYGIMDVSDRSDAMAINTFFTDDLIVPPTRFRPLSVVNGRKYMNPKSAALKEVLQDSIFLKTLMKSINKENLHESEKELIGKLPGKSLSDKFHKQWTKLQIRVNAIVDSDMDKFSKVKSSFGVKQTLEKKEGLFRKFMMGKRVNYVARSVISPDPYIMVDEVGMPEVFAKKLTYPEPVNDWNVDKLRRAVLNGPDVHPGAVKIENEDGSIVRLKADDYVQRRALACQLMTPSPFNDIQSGPKKVHRHLKNGDVLLLNRQPTLHKPSIMAHRARVLPGEKTIRLHYANCKSYNADFDGDEMNAHFPQNEVARSEGYNIVSVNHQYLVPKDGTPLTGLIQDHIVSATLLTIRGRMFNRSQYNQLVYNSIPFFNKKIEILPPCIRKPEVLWSGKQVVSTVLLNLIPDGKLPPTVEGKAKVSSKNWQNSASRPWRAGGTLLTGDDMTESEVIIRRGELLVGVLDKAHIGPTPYGLIHCCNELYGGKTSSLLLSAFGRLFTYFLQMHGFSLGIEDILLTSDASKKRKKIMRKAKKVGDEVTAAAFDIQEPYNKDELKEKMRAAYLSRDRTGVKLLDFEMKKKTDAFNNDINNICMPDGLKKKFPSNNLQLMVQSGSKGSTVNSMQISCLLGQIELEGQRVPVMMNGSTLPSFLPYDTSPRAGGFVDGRFLTGLKPQEYFFHCMAGREGLVDTAVKTSRSGYLQRCLIKHLEGVVVNYDLTVRDSDGTVIQFLYGEDGLDICKMQMLKKDRLSLLAKNYDVVMNETEVQILKNLQSSEDPAKRKKLISKWQKKHKDSPIKRSSALLSYIMDTYPHFDRKLSPNIQDEFRNLDENVKKRYIKLNKKCPDPVSSQFRPDLTFGSVSEEMDRLIEDYIKENPHSVLKDYVDSDNFHTSMNTISRNQFRSMCHYRAIRSLAQPGEAVGLLAAQSIGEPSTQMTLNTFHFAGKGEMNVTLGIPRLREILMTASSKISTPTMDLPLLNKAKIEDEAEKLKVKLTSVHLKQVLERIEIQEITRVKRPSSTYCRIYKIKIYILPYKTFSGELNTNPAAILHYIEKVFMKRIVAVTKKKLNILATNELISPVTRGEAATPTENEDETPPESVPTNLDEGASSGEEDDGDGGTFSKKSKERHDQELEYEDPEDVEMLNDMSDDGENIEKEEPEVEIEAEESNVDELVEISTADQISNTLLEEQKQRRIMLVLAIHKWVSSYDYDVKKQRWCEISLQLPIKNSKLDMTSLIEDEVNKSIVYQVPNIKRAFLVKNMKSGGSRSSMLKTEGVNFLEVCKYSDIIDINKTASNDIQAIAAVYGIEAARSTIVKEVTNVFATYGITVDPRHLYLIADYMTSDGYYKPCNRYGMESNASPLQQMTFETTMSFLKNATLTGSADLLKSPSARLVVGQPVRCGTGSFDLFVAPPKNRKGFPKL